MSISELSPVQQRILKVVGSDARINTVKSIAEAAECKEATVYRQMEDPVFREAFNHASRGRVHVQVPAILDQMAIEARSGDVKAAKMILEITGTYERRQRITGDLNTETTHIFQDDSEIKDVLSATFPDLFDDDEEDPDDG